LPPFDTATEIDLAQARDGPAFRQRLLAQNLEILLEALNRCRQERSSDGLRTAAQLREGAELAVKLANLITRLEQGRGSGRGHTLAVPGPGTTGASPDGQDR
jgi:hypothetical protein